jgi:tRNA-dihydrouridine synthase 3
MTDILSVPVTVKMRIGIEDKTPLASKLVYSVRQWNMAAAVTVHGRSRQQRYTRRADWEYIKECADIAHSSTEGLPYLPVQSHV